MRTPERDGEDSPGGFCVAARARDPGTAAHRLMVADGGVAGRSCSGSFLVCMRDRVLTVAVSRAKPRLRDVRPSL